ncbi:MAG: PilZ domain-containing protein [Acidobacteria bacterium]|nr:PilZ domain-containing protein [Acidobacteriota bacterium]
MPAPAAAAAVKTVIVADDTAFVRDRFKTALHAAGHRASAVADASELLARVRGDSRGVDLVVLDLRLPPVQGVALVRALRAIDGFEAPIVVFSGTIANADEVRELSRLGVAGYVNEYSAVQHIVPALAPHLFPNQYNRRSSPRAVLGIPVAYRLGNTIAAAVTLNVGRGGLAIRTTSPLDPGTLVKVRFRLPGTTKDIDAEARVAWAERRVGMGLHFNRIEAADEAAIDEFVRAHFFSNRKA